MASPIPFPGWQGVLSPTADPSFLHRMNHSVFLWLQLTFRQAWLLNPSQCASGKQEANWTKALGITMGAEEVPKGASMFYCFMRKNKHKL